MGATGSEPSWRSQDPSHLLHGVYKQSAESHLGSGQESYITCSLCARYSVYSQITSAPSALCYISSSYSHANASECLLLRSAHRFVYFVSFVCLSAGERSHRGSAVADITVLMCPKLSTFEPFQKVLSRD